MVTVHIEMHDEDNLVCNPASTMIGRYFLLFLFIHDPPLPFHGSPLWSFIIYALIAEYRSVISRQHEGRHIVLM